MPTAPSPTASPFPPTRRRPFSSPERTRRRFCRERTSCSGPFHDTPLRHRAVLSRVGPHPHPRRQRDRLARRAPAHRGRGVRRRPPARRLGGARPRGTRLHPGTRRRWNRAGRRGRAPSRIAAPRRIALPGTARRNRRPRNPAPTAAACRGHAPHDWRPFGDRRGVLRLCPPSHPGAPVPRSPRLQHARVATLTVRNAGWVARRRS